MVDKSYLGTQFTRFLNTTFENFFCCKLPEGQWEAALVGFCSPHPLSATLERLSVAQQRMDYAVDIQTNCERQKRKHTNKCSEH